MSLLTPLGLLGLISIIILIIIYIIRPNFQQKIISSTYIWKLSLKYRKRKLPTSKLRNVLLILCQVLILVGGAFILAKPVTATEVPTDEREVIVVIDSSASMRAISDGESRFVRAVNKALDLSETVYAKGGTMSVIIADNNPYFLAQRVDVDNRDLLTEALQPLLEDAEACSYGTSDMEQAMLLCETVIETNAEAQVYIYTDTTYDYVPEKIKLESVVVEDDWNLAILDAYTVMDDNYYSLTVDIACYGRNMDAVLKVDIHNANPDYQTGQGVTIPLDTYSVGRITCKDEKPTRIIFINRNLYQPGIGAEEGMNVFYYPLDTDQQFYSYDDILISVYPYDSRQTVGDSMQTDDTFSIYGGQKEVLKIQYASALPNPFFGNVLMSLRANLPEWDIQITQIKQGEEGRDTGFDWYIYEHTMPATLPKDGIILLANPLSAPAGSGIRIVQEEPINKAGMELLEENGDHPLLKSMTGENIMVTKYTQVKLDPLYETLLSCDGNPLLAVMNEEDTKIVVLPFSFHYSNFVTLKEFPIFMVNMLRYFFPATVDANSYEVFESVSLQARSNTLKVKTNDGKELGAFDSFPATYTFTTPGTYVLSQGQFLNKTINDVKLYVRIPQTESNILAHAATINNPYQSNVVLVHYDDWLFYIALGVVALLFIEWWLQSRDSM